MTLHLHISLGPVQGFVAQSRRTRDLWGGSYLLSLLTAHAMRGARRAGGAIVRPYVDDDPMLRWVEGRSTDEVAPPRLGSLPNQFTIELQDRTDPWDPREVAAAAERAFRGAWDHVCDAVWRRYVAELAPQGRDTEAIWRRQTRGFWELVWAAGPPDDHGCLERRKLWRTHRLPEEAGDKCTVMSELQELSGYVRATAREQREQQDAFWHTLQRRVGAIELRDNERLCSIALVKRLYARIGPDALGGVIDVARWPSTVDVAAVLWARRAVEIAPRAAEALADAVVARATDATLTGGVSSLVSDVHGGGRFVRLGANWFHRSFVASPKLWPIEDEAHRGELLDRLRGLTETPDGERGALGSPPIYYALLLADGDRLGELVRTHGGGDTVSRALARFTGEAPSIVTRHHGVTIYAGGDDVLALLPIHHALDCAAEIEQAYRRAFSSTIATLSAAVVFAHARAPLNRILAEAHRLLAEVAKEQNGRSSLAAGVYRREAPAVQWVTTWERSVADGSRKSAAACIRDAAREMAPGGARLSSSLLHDVRRVLGGLCGDASIAPGSFATLADGVDVMALLVAEIKHRLGHRDDESHPEDVARLAARVGDLLARSRRNEKQPLPKESSRPHETAPSYLGMDGLLLASFLANDGREDEH